MQAAGPVPAAPTFLSPGWEVPCPVSSVLPVDTAGPEVDLLPLCCLCLQFLWPRDSD